MVQSCLVFVVFLAVNVDLLRFLCIFVKRTLVLLASKTATFLRKMQMTLEKRDIFLGKWGVRIADNFSA
jgi:hypothetical protein